MERNSRSKNSILNVVTSSFTSIVSLVVSFANRVIFLHYLNATYLGVSGLFSNILLIFSLVELGVGAALTQMFYKPFAEKDYKHLSQVTHTTRVLLNLIGIVIVLLTIIFTPFLQLFVNDMNAVPHMRMIFFLYGISSSVTYFLGYFRTIITANQCAYKLVKIDVIWKVVTMVGLGISLAKTRNFIVYLLVQIILNFSQNVIIMFYVKKQVPYIDYRTKEFVSKEEKKGLLKNVIGLSMNRIATVVTNGTDNILISKFLDLTVVGYASNYVMIQQSVNTIVESIFGPLLASVGNICVTETDQTKYRHFINLTFLAFWLYGFCSITAYVLADPFIAYVFGTSYLIPQLATFFLCLYIFTNGICRIAFLFRTAQGLFWYGKFRPLIQSILNLLVSLLLVATTHQLWTVYAGTVISIVMVTVWYEPYVVLKYGMHKKTKKYFIQLIEYILVFFITEIIVKLFTSCINLTGLFKIVVDGMVCVVVINGIFGCFFCRTSEFKYWISLLQEFIIRKKGKGTR